MINMNLSVYFVFANKCIMTLLKVLFLKYDIYSVSWLFHESNYRKNVHIGSSVNYSHRMCTPLTKSSTLPQSYNHILDSKDP